VKKKNKGTPPAELEAHAKRESFKKRMPGEKEKRTGRTQRSYLPLILKEGHEKQKKSSTGNPTSKKGAQ